MINPVVYVLNQHSVLLTFRLLASKKMFLCHAMNRVCIGCSCMTHHFFKIFFRCVEEQYRINSTVGIPVTVFNEPGFITVFENHVTSLIEGTADGKTLTQLVEEFNGKFK